MSQREYKKDWAFYHYTDEKGLQGILESGCIKQSNPENGDAFHGEGVYGNWLNPFKYSKSEVAGNNYAAFGNALQRKGKVDYCIKTRVPKENLTRIEKNNRGILLHKGNIPLQKGKFEVYEVKSWPQSCWRPWQAKLWRPYNRVSVARPYSGRLGPYNRASIAPPYSGRLGPYNRASVAHS